MILLLVQEHEIPARRQEPRGIGPLPDVGIRWGVGNAIRVVVGVGGIAASEPPGVDEGADPLTGGPPKGAAVLLGELDGVAAAGLNVEETPLQGLGIISRIATKIKKDIDRAQQLQMPIEMLRGVCDMMRDRHLGKPPF